MFCPSCSSPTADGAKFCKSCGFSLTVITQALSGSSTLSDPLRDREFKRARKQITDGIQGASIGAALAVGAIVAYILMPQSAIYYIIELILALAGVIKLFKSIGHIIDAKVGTKLLNQTTPQRGTGALPTTTPQTFAPVPPTTRVSQRLPGDATTPVNPSKEPGPASPDRPANPGFPSVPGTTRVGTGRVYREHSSPLRKPEKEGGFLSKLRG